MAVSVFSSITELEKRLKGTHNEINNKIWELLLYTPATQVSLESILAISNSITFNLRCSQSSDQASALECLINLFLSRTHYATGQYKFEPLSSHLQILLLLFRLQNQGIGAQMTEVSWKLLKYLQKIHKKNHRLAPQPDLFTESHTLNIINSVQGKTDFFFQSKGQIFQDYSRFGEFSEAFPRVLNKEQLSLGTASFELPGHTWFEADSGDFMGAFLHLQLQDSNNPFNISLKLPPIESVKTTSDFPFPCINKVSKEDSEETIKQKFDWHKVVFDYEKYGNLPEFHSEAQKKFPMWENCEKTVRLQKSWKDVGEAYEKKLRNSLDEEFCKNIAPMDPTNFIRNVKNLILGIPNQLFDLIDYKPHSRFRLKSMSHSVLLNILSTTVQFSKTYKFLSQLAITLQSKTDLISPSFARGIRNVLSFIENYIINVPDTLTLIQFVVQTQSLREQVESLRTVCKDLPTGYKMIDYIYLILTKNEGDFENYHLLQKLFKNIIQPILESLTYFTYSTEISDLNKEFFLQYNREVLQAKEYSVEKYINSFVALPTQIFAPVIGPLLEIGRNMRVLKLLDRDLSPYFQLLSAGTISSLDTSSAAIPQFRLSYKTMKIVKISDEFLAFNAEQTRCLMQLESVIVKHEQKIALRITEVKAAKQNKNKLASLAQQKMESEKAQEKQRKQWSFFTTLENQLKENQELRRIAEEKRISEEKKLEEKLEQEKRELIEKGKKLLLEQHEEMLNVMYLKTALEDWKAKRTALDNKRKALWVQISEAEVNEIEGRMQIDRLEPILGYTDAEVPSILFDPTPVIESLPPPEPTSDPFVRIKQPPGGFSTIQTLFNDPIEFSQPKIDPFTMPRIGYNESLEKWEICSSVLYEEIIKKVFRKITPARPWELSTKPEPSHSFDDLFDDFENKKQASKNLVIPFNKVLEKLIVQPIRMQAEIVNKTCLHLVVRKLKLVEHLRAFKRYALLEAGDTIDLFLNTIFSLGFGGNTTAAWEGCLKMSSSRDDEYGELIRISMKSNNLYRMQFKTVEDLEFLQLDYRVQGPLELIFSQSRVEEYSKAFVSLLRVKYVTSILSNIKTFKVPINHLYYKKIHLLRQKMQHFIDIYHGYIASELHGTAWNIINSEIAKAQNLTEIIMAHQRYLDLILTRCFLKENGKRVMSQLNMIFQLVMRFRNIVMELDEFSLREIEVIEEDFNSIHRFLFKMTQKMAANGYFPELFLRLDFNYYMTDKIERERVL